LNLAPYGENDKVDSTYYLRLNLKTAKLVGEVTISNPRKDKRVFTFVEESAEPIGGLSAFYVWLGKNLQYPVNARRQRIEGKVFVKFVVEQSGEITNVEVVKGFNAECNQEAMRVISKSPNWKPGRQQGVPVRQAYTLPIAFHVN
jgi:protein TonB